MSTMNDIHNRTEPSVAQVQIISSIINHLKTIMIVPNGGNIVDLKHKYNELFLDNDIAITGLEILSHKASSIFMLLQEMFFVNLDTRNAVIQTWKFEEARILLNQSLAVIENLETDTNILLPVNDIRIKNLLLEIKNIQYDEITAEQLLKIRHLFLDIQNIESLSGLKDTRFEINEIIEFIDESLVKSEEEKIEKQRLSSHSLVLNLLREAYRYLDDLTQDTLDLPEETSDEVEELMIQITDSYRSVYSIKYSSLQDLHEAIDNFKIDFEENHDRGILNIAKYTENVKDMINILQNVLNIKNKAGERYGIINQASKLVSSITLSFNNLLPTEGTTTEKSFSIIDKFNMLFSNILEDNYLCCKETIQILEEYKKSIEYLKIDTISLIGVSNIDDVITKADSTMELINQKLFLENSIYESFNSFSRGKTVLDLFEKVILSLNKIRLSINIDNTLNIGSVIQPIFNINDDLTVVTDKITTNTLLNVLTALFKIEDMEAKPDDIDQIIEIVLSVKGSIKFYVATLEREYRSLDSDQIAAILTTQVDSVSTEFDILIDFVINSTKLVGETRIEFQKFFKILENWNQNLLEIDFKSIINFKDEWNKLAEFISFNNDDSSVAFGGLIDIYIMLKQISSQVRDFGKIRKEMNIFETKVEILDEKVLVITNILTDIETFISSIKINQVANFEIDKDISKIISVFENLNLEVSVEELNKLKKSVFSLGISDNAGLFQLKLVVSQSLTKFNTEVSSIRNVVVSQIKSDILSRVLAIIIDLEENLNILSEITDPLSETEIELPIMRMLSKYLISASVITATESDINTLNIILNDLFTVIGTLDSNVRVHNMNDILTSLKNLKNSIKTTLLETTNFINRAITLKSLVEFTKIIDKLDNTIQNFLNGKVLPSGDINATIIIDSINSIIEDIVQSKEISEDQISSFIIMVNNIELITLTIDVIGSLENITVYIPDIKMIIDKKIISFKEMIADKVRFDNMKLYENLLLGISNSITDFSKEIGYVDSMSEKIINKDITILINYLQTVSAAVVSGEVLKNLQFKISFLNSLQVFKGRDIEGLTDLNIITSMKIIELKESKNVFENILKLDDQNVLIDKGIKVLNMLFSTIGELTVTNITSFGIHDILILEIENIMFIMSKQILYSKSDIKDLENILFKLNIIKSSQFSSHVYSNMQVYLTIIKDKITELKNENAFKKSALLKAKEIFLSQIFLDILLQKVIKITSNIPLLNTELVAVESVENEFVSRLIDTLTIWSINSFTITQESLGSLMGEIYKLDIVLKENNRINNILMLKENILAVQKSISIEISIIMNQIDLEREILIKTEILDKLWLLSITLYGYIDQQIQNNASITYNEITEMISDILTSTENKEIFSLFSVQFTSIYELLTDNHVNSQNDATILITELLGELTADITKNNFQLDNLYLVFRQKKMSAMIQEITAIIGRLKDKFAIGFKIYSENEVFGKVLDIILNLDVYVATDDSVLELSNIILDLNDIFNTIPAGSIINELHLILKTIVTKAQMVNVEIKTSIQNQVLTTDTNILRDIAKVFKRIIDECADNPLDTLYNDLDNLDFHPVFMEFYTLTKENIKYDIETLLHFLNFEKIFNFVLIEEKHIEGLHNFKLDVKKQLTLIEFLITKQQKTIEKNRVTLVAGKVQKIIEGITILLPVHNVNVERQNVEFDAEVNDFKKILLDIDVETMTHEVILKFDKFVEMINITTVNGAMVLNTDLSLLADPLYLFRKKLKESTNFNIKFSIEETKTMTIDSSKKSNERATNFLLNIKENKEISSCLTNELSHFKQRLKNIFQTSTIINKKIDQTSKTISQNTKSLKTTSKFKETGSAILKFKSFIQNLPKNESVAIVPNKRQSRLFGVKPPFVDDFKKIAGAAADVARGAVDGASDVASDIISGIDKLVVEPAVETLFGDKGVVTGLINLFDDAISRIEESNIFQLGIIATRDFVLVIEDADNLLLDLKSKIANLEGFNITTESLKIIQDIERIGNLWFKGISFVTLEDVIKCQSYMTQLGNVEQGDIEFDFSLLFTTLDDIKTSVTNGLITQSLFTHTYEIANIFKGNPVRKALGDALQTMVQRTQKFDLATQCVGMLETTFSMFTDLQCIVNENDLGDDNSDEPADLINNIYELLRTVSFDVNNLDISDVIDFGKLLVKLDPFTNITNTGRISFNYNRFQDIKNFINQMKVSVNETSQNIANFIEDSRIVLFQKRASTEIEAVSSTLKDWINIIGEKKSEIVSKIDDASQETFNKMTNFIINWGLSSKEITEDAIVEFKTLFKQIEFLDVFPGQVIKGFNLWKIYLLDAPVTLLELLQSGGQLAANTYLASDKLQLLQFTEAKQTLESFLVKVQSLFDSLPVGGNIDVEVNENLKALIKNALSTSKKWTAGLIENFHIKGFKKMEEEFNALSLNLINVDIGIISSLESLISSLEHSLAKIDIFIENINIQILEIELDVHLDDAFNVISHMKYFIDDLVFSTDLNGDDIIISHFENVVNTLKNFSSDYMNIDTVQSDLNPFNPFNPWLGSVEAIFNFDIGEGLKIENVADIKKIIHSYMFSLGNDIIKNKYNKIKNIAENLIFHTSCPLFGNCSKDIILSIDAGVNDLFKFVSHLEKDIYDIGIDQIRTLSSMTGSLSYAIIDIGHKILHLDDITKILSNVRSQLRKYNFAKNLNFEWNRDLDILADARGEIERLEISLRDLQFNIGGVNLNNTLQENENITNIFNQLLNFTADTFSLPLFLNDLLTEFDFTSAGYTPEVGILYLNEVVQILGHLTTKQDTSESLVNEFEFLDSILKSEAITSNLLQTMTDFKISFKDVKTEIETDRKTDILPNLLVSVRPLLDIQEKITKKAIDNLKIGADVFFSLPINRVSEIKDITHLIFQLSQASSHLHTLSSSLEISIQSKFEHSKLKEILDAKIRLHSFLGKMGSSEVPTVISELEDLLDSWIPEIRYETADRFRFLVYQLGSAINLGGQVIVESVNITEHLPRLKTIILSKLQTTLSIIANSKKIKELRDSKSTNSLIDDHANFGLTYHYDINSQIFEKHLEGLFYSLLDLTDFETINGGLSFENSSVLLDINDFLLSFKTVADTFTFGATEHLIDISKSIRENITELSINSIVLSSLIISVNDTLNLIKDTRAILTSYTESVSQFLQYEYAGFELKEFKNQLHNIDEILNEEGAFNTNISVTVKDINVYTQISKYLIDIAFDSNLFLENNILHLHLNLQRLRNYKFVQGETINGISLWNHFLLNSEDNLPNIMENIYQKNSFKLAKIHQTINKFSHGSQILMRYLSVIEKLENITEAVDIDDGPLNGPFVDFDVTQKIYGLVELSLETMNSWTTLLDIDSFEINIIESSYKTIEQLMRTLKVNPFTDESDEATVALVTIKDNVVNTIKDYIAQIEEADTTLHVFSKEKKQKIAISEKINNLKQLKNIVLFVKEKIACEIGSINEESIENICNLLGMAGNVTNILDEQGVLENYTITHNLILTLTRHIGIFIDDIESACSLPANGSSEVTSATAAAEVNDEADTTLPALVVTTTEIAFDFVGRDIPIERVVTTDCIDNQLAYLDSLPDICETIIVGLEEMLLNFEFSVNILTYLNLED
ncbi:unnamed protein product [Meganyctiphanes norvegica]|uniref:Uncharacterized protein n=1 Tax=Meganyctiphanes norvegica TaxID=48144 RepID=A0AAV2SSR0_MEGNR